MLIQPLLAQQAAINSTGYQVVLVTMPICTMEGNNNVSNAHNRLNRIIAEAPHDTVLQALFDQLNEICRTVVWEQLRSQNSTGSNDHYSFVLQDEIVRGIRERDLKLINKQISMKQVKYMD